MYLFNPEHDICLANNDPHFVPPAAALAYAQKEPEMVRLMQGLEPESEHDPLAVVPWGWNKVLRTRLLKAGYPARVLPSDQELDAIRALSHRQVAAQALEAVQAEFPSQPWPSVPVAATSLAQIRQQVEGSEGEADAHWVLKAPWSGSGRGLRWAGGAPLTDSDVGWCKHVLEKQGAVMIEPRLTVVQDAAMLFRCTDRVSFVGYSLFYTQNGAYQKNRVDADEVLEAALAAFVPLPLLWEVRRCLMDFLQQRFVGRYRGYLGIDQFVYQANGGTLYHPAVEINVRMTMGLLAHQQYVLHQKAAYM